MHVVGLFVCLAVDIHYVVLDLQGLTWQSETTLNVVLATVNRTGDEFAILLRVREDVLSACLIGELVEMAQIHRLEAVELHIDALLMEYLLTKAVAHLVVVLRLPAGLRHHCIACRVVKHHDVVELYLAQSWRTTIVPLRPLDVRLDIAHWQRMLGEGHSKRSLRNAWTVAHLRNEKVIACEQ